MVLPQYLLAVRLMQPLSIEAMTHEHQNEFAPGLDRSPRLTALEAPKSATAVFGESTKKAYVAWDLDQRSQVTEGVYLVDSLVFAVHCDAQCLRDSWKAWILTEVANHWTHRSARSTCKYG